MSDSILLSTKKILGIAADYTAFDLDVMTHINSVFSDLNQFGVGPTEGFMIDGEEDTWDAFLGSDPNLNSVKTYVYLRVRFLFDPPTTSYHLTAIQSEIAKLEWRLNAYREETKWVDPNPVVLSDI